MKRLLLLIFLVGNPACPADFEKGSETYGRRDYETVSKEWKPPAKQGHINFIAAIKALAAVEYQHDQSEKQREK